MSVLAPAKSAWRAGRRLLPSVRADRRGVAMLEFAFVLPVLLTLILVGTELTNYIIVRTRLSQLALRLADDAARVGKGSQLSSKKVSEIDINDLFLGANMQSGALDLSGRGRVILSDLEPVANPNSNNRYKIVWQRCYGSQTGFGSSYGTAGQTDMPGMGPTDRPLVTAQDNNATMFIEVGYLYRPLLAPATIIPLREIASMAVRDARDLTQIYNSENVAASTC